MCWTGGLNSKTGLKSSGLNSGTCLSYKRGRHVYISIILFSTILK